MKIIQKKTKKKAKLANPVTSLANKISTLFEGDSSISPKFYFNKSTLRIICDKQDVAIALASICKSHFDLGNLFLDIQFLYLDSKGRKKQVKDVQTITDPAKFTEAFVTAFCNCETYGGIVEVEDPFGTTWHYLLGSKHVCQFDNDDTRNPWGVTTCLAEEIFYDLFVIPNGVKISTVFVEPNK